MKSENLSLIERITLQTPKIFRIFRTIGLSLASAGGAIIAAPAMPVILTTVAGYLIAAGSVMTAISQVAVQGE